MKFIHYLESITGVSIFPLLSLLIFFLFFVALIWYVVKADKTRIHDMKHLPLDNQKNN